MGANSSNTRHERPPEINESAIRTACLYSMQIEENQVYGRATGLSDLRKFWECGSLFMVAT